jgi:hypothetical protein
VVVVALALRVAYVFIYRRNFDPHGDAFFCHAGANLLAEGKGFISPFFVRAGLHRAAAERPPRRIASSVVSRCGSRIAPTMVGTPMPTSGKPNSARSLVITKSHHVTSVSP